MKPIKLIARRILRILRLDELIGLSRFALKEYGWILSARSTNAVDAEGNPLPWITYPAIDILKLRANKSLKVFEFGCGNSTLWWAERTGVVHSVEHDGNWFEKMKKLVPENVSLDFVPLEYGDAYSKKAQEGGPYDIIIIDGRDRVNCIKNSVAALSRAGVIILDNSDRKEYSEGTRFLAEHGFKQLPLRGLAPIVNYVSETSFFYRTENVLGL